MKFASSVAVLLSPAFLWKASAEDQAVLVEWEASIDETGKEVTKETVYAVDAVYSAPPMKKVVNIGVLNVYEEPVTIFKNIPGEMVAPSAHEESFGSYATSSSKASKPGSSKTGKTGSSKSSKSTSTTTTAATTTTTGMTTTTAATTPATTTTTTTTAAATTTTTSTTTTSTTTSCAVTPHGPCTPESTTCCPPGSSSNPGVCCVNGSQANSCQPNFNEGNCRAS